MAELKKLVQDIVPTSRRTIRNISLQEEESFDDEKPTKIPIHIRPRKMREEPEEYANEVRSKPKKKNRLKGTIIAFFVVFVCIVIIAIALSLLYSKAVVTITPKIAHIEVSGTFTAKKDAISPDLPYEIITTKASDHQMIPSTLGPNIETKAKGTINLYNEQLVPQKLVAGTRLSNTKGFIYRLTSSVVIPAGKSGVGKITPGNISTVIIADKAGTPHNILLSDLTGDLKIVAYKGTDKYATVYGRIKTDITGGFSGRKQIISSETQKTIVGGIQESLNQKINRDLSKNVPENYILFDSASIVTYDTSNSTTQNSSSSTDVTVTATGYGIIFKSDTLLKFIGQKELEKFPSSYYIKGLEGLAFNIVNKKDFSPQKGNSLIFTLKGPISLVSTFNKDSLKNDLKGIGLDESKIVFANYRGIGNAYALVTPFWMRTFPKSTEKIILDIKSE